MSSNQNNLPTVGTYDSSRNATVYSTGTWSGGTYVTYTPGSNCVYTTAPNGTFTIQQYGFTWNS